MSSVNQPSERVNLFFGQDGVLPTQSPPKEDNVFKNYIIRQNQNIMDENKKLRSRNRELSERLDTKPLNGD